MQLPLVLTLRPSRQLALLMLASHGGALLALVAIAVPIWIGLTLLLLIFWSGWNVLRNASSYGRIIHLKLQADGRLGYTRLNGESGESLVHPQSTVTPRLAIILLRMGGRRESLVLLPDALNAADFRRLRLWLRWQAAMQHQNGAS